MAALADRYIEPPFSVLDTTSARWRTRREWWLGLGIQSEVGRTGNAPGGGDKGGRGAWLRKSGPSYSPTDGKYADDGVGAEGASGVSIFDPVLCELVYRWFAPPGGVVLDPFAGGSVRGIVAAFLGHPYVGVELREEQVESNREQAQRIVGGDMPMPEWLVGDSRSTLRTLDIRADLVFTCPPYFDLEVYSDDPRDLSAMPSYDAFIAALRDVVYDSARLLQPGRFAAFVLSEIRGRDGRYRGLVPDGIAAMEDAGLAYYNDVVLLNAIGSLPVRAARQFGGLRKVGRRDQNLVVSVNGIPEHGWSEERQHVLDPQQEFAW